ncbi:hypothetical protein [Streptomyces sp. NPDC054940]
MPRRVLHFDRLLDLFTDPADSSAPPGTSQGVDLDGAELDVHLVEYR